MDLVDVIKALRTVPGAYDNDDDDYTYKYNNGSDSINWSKLAWSLEGEPKHVSGLGIVELVEDYGGEGMGDTRYVVIKVTNNDGDETYYRKDGYYASYDGSTFDGDFREVTPRDRVVTYYE